jgi:deazaflavin-dependent oxidoreductase (nitroreductase family)
MTGRSSKSSAPTVASSGARWLRPPLLLLHHVGVRSGHEWVTPLAWWSAGETSVAVLASNFGAPRHPAWYYDLLAKPTTIAEIRTDIWRVHSRVAVANERSHLLALIKSATQSAAAAVRKTQREIPLVVLDLLGRLDGRAEQLGAFS